MKEASQEVVQQNCIRCHLQQVTQVKYDGWIDGHRENRTGRQCWSCHKQVPHGKVHGLSTIKFNVAPLPLIISNSSGGYVLEFGYDEINSIPVEDVLMLMVYDKLRVGVVASHVSIKETHTYITKEIITSKLNILNNSLETAPSIKGVVLSEYSITETSDPNLL